MPDKIHEGNRRWEIKQRLMRLAGRDGGLGEKGEGDEEPRLVMSTE